MRNERTHHDNDNEQLSFITLSAATKNVIRYLQPHEKQDEQRDGNTDRDRTDEQRAKDHRAYIEQRLRDIAEFERRYVDTKN
jgi:hypothetical protein